MAKITAKEKRMIQQITYDVSAMKWDNPGVAFSEIDNRLHSFGYSLAQEDGYEWSGMFIAGAENEEHRELMPYGKLSETDDYGAKIDIFDNSMLVFHWYKGNGMKRWEVTAYFS